MGIFSWLFKSKTAKPTGKKSDPHCSVEHYPLTGRYYAKYKGDYLRKNKSTGIIELLEDYLFPYSNHFNSEEGAWELIELFKEHKLKVNVRTITR